MRRAVTTFLRLMLRLFFRRIEVVGLDRVPLDAPVIFAANHPNGLVDPLFILSFAPRPVSFLAKAPLFRYPLIGYFVRALDSIPVYRKQDKTTGSNRETFERAREVLRGGGSIAIFPEGTTHSDPRLRELKTGAARIALGAEMNSIAIVPAGIYYTAKQTFRSEALVWFGEAILVEDRRCRLSGQADGEPSHDTVNELTVRIEAQLATVTLQADSHAALELITRAEEIFSAGSPQPLAAEFELRRRFVDGYHYLREHDPEQLERLASSVRQFESELGGAPLDASFRAPKSARNLSRWVFLLPIALAGVIIHFIPYRIIDALSKRFSRDADEMTATIKFIAALLFYPLTWGIVAFLVWRWWGITAGILAMALLPAIGYVTLWVMEQLDEFTGTMRALMHRTASRATQARLVAHQQLLREQIVVVAEVINR
jgi:1-acyl-sn-glycerol-3-phosphate acyltransferase